MSDRVDRSKVLRRWYEMTAVILLNTLLVFLMLNLVVAVVLEAQRVYVRATAPREAPYRYEKYNKALEQVYPGLTKEEINQILDETKHLRQQYAPYVQHKEAPCNQKHIKVDRLGFRHGKNQGPWPPQKDRMTIFVFGGSTAFGYGVPDEQTIASHLQDCLESRDTRSAKVYNFGRAHYFLTMERILFEQLLLSGIAPDVAVFVDGVNEFTRWEGVPAYTARLERFMEEPFLRERDISHASKLFKQLPVGRLVSWVQELVRSKSSKEAEAIKEGPASRVNQEEVLSSVLNRYDGNMRTIETLAKTYGVIPVFVWQPTPVYHYDMKYHIFAGWDYQGTSPFLKPGYEKMGTQVSRYSGRKNFVWLADIQADLKEPLYVSGLHYSPKMGRIIAEAIAQQLKAREPLL